MAARNVIVTGATGKQGRAFIQELLYPSNTNGSAAPTYRVWAVARDTASPAATRLLKVEKSHGNDIRIIQGDRFSLKQLLRVEYSVSSLCFLIQALETMAETKRGKAK